tara:strand:+ start:7642 stop:10023 length:2382 start_codon:yes stop_codon:yes gene_type:complete
MDRVRSQKAAALLNYNSHYSRNYDIPKYTIVLLLEDGPKYIRQWFKETDNEWGFLRTCPLTPRHGVLESTRIHRDDFLMHWARLRNSMMEHDPEGCLILQDCIEAQHSAVMAPGKYVVVGEGHDGITAGHGTNLTFPIRDGGRLTRNLRTMGSDPDEHEVEFVMYNPYTSPERRAVESEDAHDRVSLTQVRGATGHVVLAPPPEGVTVNGFITEGRVEVTQVFEATGLEEVAWLEEKITKDKVPKGFVVSEPGGSLLSHICAHCRQHGIPYIIGDVGVGESWVEPAAGWVINDPDHDFVAKPYDPAEYTSEFIAGVRYSNLHWEKQYGWLATFFHQWVAMPMSNPSTVAYLAGVFAGWIVKSTFAICAGEMRHARGRKKNYTPDIPVFLHAAFGESLMLEVNPNLLEYGDNPVMDIRKHYYACVSKIDFESYTGAASLLDYMYKRFRTNWENSYGGPAWAEAAKLGSQAAIALQKFMDDGELGPMLGAINKLENHQHNTGHLFNKFISKTAFDSGTSGFKETDMEYVTKTFRIANHVMQERDTKVTRGSETHLNWTALGKWLKKNTPNHQRKMPIHSSEQPEFLKDALSKMTYTVSHSPNTYHDLTNPKNNNFVPCGKDGCHTCLKHENWKSNPNPNYTVSKHHEWLEQGQPEQGKPEQDEPMAVFILPDFDEGGYFHEEKTINETSLYEAVLTDMDALASYITSFNPSVVSLSAWEGIMQDYDALYETVIESSSQFTHHEHGDLSSKMGALKWLIDDYVKRWEEYTPVTDSLTAGQIPKDDPDDEEWVEPNW